MHHMIWFTCRGKLLIRKPIPDSVLCRMATLSGIFINCESTRRIRTSPRDIPPDDPPDDPVRLSDWKWPLEDQIFSLDPTTRPARPFNEAVLRSRTWTGWATSWSKNHFSFGYFYFYARLRAWEVISLSRSTEVNYASEEYFELIQAKSSWHQKISKIGARSIQRVIWTYSLKCAFTRYKVAILRKWTVLWTMLEAMKANTTILRPSILNSLYCPIW